MALRRVHHLGYELDFRLSRVSSDVITHAPKSKNDRNETKNALELHALGDNTLSSSPSLSLSLY